MASRALDLPAFYRLIEAQMKKSDAVPWEDAKARLEQKWTAEEAGKSVRTRPKPRTRTARPAKKARSPRV